MAASEHGVRTLIVVNAKTSTGSGSVYELPRSFSAFALQATTTGTPTTFTVKLEGSLDGTNWTDMGAELTQADAAGLIKWVTGKPVTWIRGSLTVLTGGSSPTVTARATASE